MILVFVGRAGCAFGHALAKTVLKSRSSYRTLFSEAGFPKFLFITAGDEHTSTVLRCSWGDQPPVVFRLTDPRFVSGRPDTLFSEACQPADESLDAFPAHTWRGPMDVPGPVLRAAFHRWLVSVVSHTDDLRGLVFVHSLHESIAGIVPQLIEVARAGPMPLPAYIAATALSDTLPGVHGAATASWVLPRVLSACDTVLIADRDALGPPGPAAWVDLFLQASSTITPTTRIPSIARAIADRHASHAKGGGIVVLTGGSARGVLHGVDEACGGAPVVARLARAVK